MIRATLAACGFALLCLLPPAQAQVNPPTAAPTASNNLPPILHDVGIDQKPGAFIPPDLLFRDETGRPVRLGDFLGRRPIILTLVYFRCPMLCTLVLDDLTHSLNLIPATVGKDFDILTVSFDPHEGPDLATAKKRSYLTQYRRDGAAAGWHFLTGTQDSIARLTAAVGFHYVWDAKYQLYAHPSGIVVLKPDGSIFRYFFGIDYAPTDLRLALTEAAGPTRATPVTDQILLYCFHYDPTTGKYGLLVSRLPAACSRYWFWARESGA
jgi:protein SCO1